MTVRIHAPIRDATSLSRGVSRLWQQKTPTASRRHELVSLVSTQIMFNQILPAGAGRSFNPSLQGLKRFPESHHRQVVDCSILTHAIDSEKQWLGLNNPPPAGGGIRKTRTCVDTNDTSSWRLESSNS